MKIAVNTRLLLKNKLEGIGRFSYETLMRLTKKHPEHEFYFIFDRPYSKEFIFSDNIIPIVAGLPTRHPILWYKWLEFTMPKVLKNINADVFLSPDGFISLKTKIPQIAVIHDINFVHNPKQLPKIASCYYNYFFPKYATKASHICTVSEYSKSDISQSFNIPNDNITVCYNAANEIYVRISEEEKRKVKLKYTDDNDFFVFVGSFSPRKNIPGLLKSYELYRGMTTKTEKLIIVGSALHLTSEIDLCLKTMKFKEDVIFTGHLELPELHKVLASALALVFVPFFEGFGIPLVEAMNTETAIISGNTTSLPEVVGEAALLCSPHNHVEIANNMKLISDNLDSRLELIEKAKIQREKFSWDKSSETLWNCILNNVNR